ncbi:hypothetical protein MTBLM5_110004 [Magnetospirillum sp. LM-5]|uniref:tellurite resistance TerB family protein n=1 Tax=Magnetospirillum sp. LM-5 TaxID=2681466 RepID=UPI001381E318|nr:TerB family tellurite resistance protein [Magnetospirillum sp. LM-5]CAA7613250.1 hypothetical protein MTBLM5_110004 [Magnetospirillum sp. LM-5]
MTPTDLTLDQCKAIAIFAFHMMVADHKAVQAEIRRVDWLEKHLGVEGKIAPAEYFAEPDIALFPDSRSRVALLAELYQVALADGYEHPDEHALLKRLIKAFLLPSITMSALNDWAHRPADSRPPLFEAVPLR